MCRAKPCMDLVKNPQLFTGSPSENPTPFVSRDQVSLFSRKRKNEQVLLDWRGSCRERQRQDARRKEVGTSWNKFCFSSHKELRAHQAFFYALPVLSFSAFAKKGRNGRLCASARKLFHQIILPPFSSSVDSQMVALFLSLFHATKHVQWESRFFRKKAEAHWYDS